LVAACTIVLALSAVLWPDPASAEPLADGQVRQRMIDESIAAYPGSCPCPYNLARNGSRCGGRSAWSKPGGYAPLCYPDDIDESMVRAYRDRYDITAPAQ
jgi:hypothetical protein